MKKLFCALSSFIAISAIFAQTSTENTVACIGKIVPADRISKLSANSPTGAQPVIKEILVKKGDLVKKGQIIAILEGIDKAKASYQTAISAQNAVKSASAIRLQQQVNMIEDMEGTYGQNKRILDQANASRREEEQIKFEQETLLRQINQTKGMLELVKVNEANIVAQSQSAVNEAKAHLDEYTLVSPIDGEIIEFNCERGESIGMDGVCEIANTTQMYVEAEVYVADVSKINVGNNAEMFLNGVSKNKFTGSIVEISSYVKSNRIFSADPSDYTNTKVVLAKIKLDDSQDFKNLIGTQVNVRIILN